MTVALLFSCLMTIHVGCVASTTGAWAPHISDEYRSTIRTVEIEVAEELPRVSLELPAKGASDGALRKSGKWTGNWVQWSIGAGAWGRELGVTVSAGMFIVLPVVAAAGAVSGAIEAPTVETVESQEAQVQGVLQGEQMIREVEMQVRRSITDWTDFELVVLPKTEPGQIREGSTDDEVKPDARLRIVLSSVELRGPRDVDPPLALHLKAHVSLLNLRPTPPTQVYSKTINEKGKARHLTEWTGDEAASFRAEVDRSLAALAQTIVNEVFRAPIAASENGLPPDLPPSSD